MKPLKSKTIDTALALAVIGVIETNWPIIAPLLGEYQGLAYVVIAIIFAVLRYKTTQPLRDK